MTPFDPVILLAELQMLGIELRISPSGDRLLYRPRHAISPEWVVRLKTHKAELLAELQKRRELDGRLARELLRMVPHTTPDGRRGWIDPGFKKTFYEGRT